MVETTSKLSDFVPSIAWLAVYVVMILYIIFPVYWLLLNTFQPLSQLYSNPQLIPDPRAMTIQNFVALIEETIFATYFKNSIIVAFGATILTTTFATFGGYGLTRSSINIKKRQNLARGLLFLYMFPPVLLGVPLYGIFYNLGLLNSYIALMIAHLALTLPLCLWIMWQYFQSIPIAYEESAWVNGASRVRTLFEIIIPAAKPGIAAVIIFSFAFSWNDFTFAVILMTEQSMKTIPVGMAGFTRDYQTLWGKILAGSVLAMIPSFIVLLFGQKYFLEGATLTE